MLRAIKITDPVYVYNLTHNQFLSKPDARVNSAGKVVGYPVLTANPSDAGLMVIVNTQLEGKPLEVGDMFMLRSVTEKIGTAVYLGISSTSDQARFYEADKLVNIGWSAAGSAADKTMYYGRPYRIRHKYSDRLLRKQDTSTNVTAEIVFVVDQSDEWVFVPTTSLFTCQRSVNQCVETRGSDNTFNPMICVADAAACVNQYGEPMYTTERLCREKCGIVDVESEVAGVQLVAQPVKLTTADSSSYLWIKVALAGVVVVLLVYFVKRNRAENGR